MDDEIYHFAVFFKDTANSFSLLFTRVNGASALEIAKANCAKA
jgi:hypothetical protein